MSFVMVDIESDGPIPGDYSMICFGAAVAVAEGEIVVIANIAARIKRLVSAKVH